MVIDFSNRKNRFITLEEIPEEYIQDINNRTLSDEYYPTYHIAPAHGLLNDPNGLTFHNGEHHIFYQWFPLGPVHGLKHWYHLSTKNFVDFEDHGVALYPDNHYDRQGCFSGGALSINEDLYLYYTGNRRNEDGEFEQVQCLAIQRNNGKIQKIGPIIKHDPELTTLNFRDPVPFRRNQKTYLMVGGENLNHEGTILLYQQKGESASYLNQLQLQVGEFGNMWECPSYFEEDKHGVLIFSPQGVTSEDPMEFNNVFSVVYFIGDPIDFELGVFHHDAYVELDKGFDFYAPQVYTDATNRHILMGWLGNSKSEYPTDKNMWAHMLTIPREIRIKNRVLQQVPLEELKGLRKERKELLSTQELVDKAFEVDGTLEKSFSFEISNELGENLRFYSTGEHYVLDRSETSELHAERFGVVRHAVRNLTYNQDIRIFIDTSSIELFLEDGTIVFTSRFFLKGQWRIKVNGMTGSLYPLSSILIK
ncbi:MAG: sucrose-6-phosphate hydrolase [Exiguobacterium oxidotolerans]